jgi:membrane-bound lytic murein transglycosylase MltF
MTFSRIRGGIVSILLICVIYSKSSHARIYAYVDANGKLVVSQKQDDPRLKLFDPSGKSKSGQAVPSQHNQQYRQLIEKIAAEVGVSEHLLHAVIQAESNYNPQAISPKGAQGLMQLIPATAQRFGVEQVHDPESNVRGGARYLKTLLQLFKNDLKLAIAAYNAGEGTVQRYNNTIPPYPETQAYVARVISVMEQRQSADKNSSRI